jgi:cytochrome P450
MVNRILQPTLGDNSVLLLDGDRHKRQRQLLMPPFHGERMRTYGELITQITEQVTQQLQVGQPFTVRAIAPTSIPNRSTFDRSDF